MKDNSIKLVTLGFSAILILMLAVALISQHQMRENNQILSNLISNTNVKIQSANTMRDAIRVRENIMLTMQATSDVFARDELYMDLLNYAGYYKAARRSLLNTNLNEYEQTFLHALDILTQKAEPINNNAAEMLLHNESSSQIQQHIIQSKQLQIETMAILDKLVEVENDEVISSHDTAVNHYKQTSYIIYTVSFVAVFLCVTVILMTVRNVRNVNRRITHQATHDDLTGLVNRREFKNRIRTALQHARMDDRHHALLFMDLDQFKLINDSCGHLAGDRLLQKIPQLINGIIRQHDTLARLGGDEFGLLMEDCNIDKAVLVAEDIREKILNYRFRWEDKVFSVGVSIGISVIDSQVTDIQNVFSSADAACYIAKDNGRNMVHIHNQNDEKFLKQQNYIEWISRLTEGTDNNHYHLYFQPIIPLRESNNHLNPVYYEALIRYKSDDGLVHTPDKFLPAAERFGKIQILDRWVIQHAIRLFSQNKSLAEKSMLSINLSGRSLVNNTLQQYIKKQINDNHLDPSRLCFEITETEVIASLDSAIKFMKDIKSLGCKFALDDFGSGLSSFTYLKNLPVDILKIDGSFVKNIANDPIDREMVRAIHNIGKIMGIITVAEYVETESIIKVLTEIGVDYMQGYAISRPMSELVDFRH